MQQQKQKQQQQATMLLKVDRGLEVIALLNELYPQYDSTKKMMICTTLKIS
jgi:hypothetical protein